MRNKHSFTWTRRHWLAHCSLLGLAVASWGTITPALASNPPAEIGTQNTILVVGDSLSAEYGLARGSGWVALLQSRLDSQKVPARVVNASISGDTTSGGRSRLPALLNRHRPTHVIIELGGNDALRGLDLRLTEANLTAMTQSASQAGARITLIGMQVPPNYGAAYSRDFSDLFARVAKTHKTALVPFFLKNVADVPQSAQLFQGDRIHPNEQAQALMLENVWSVLRPQLKTQARSSS